MLRKALDIGKLPGMSNVFLKRLQAVNIMLFVCASNSLIYSAILMFYDLEFVANIILGFSISFFGLIYLQSKYKTNTVRSFLLLFLNLFIFFFTLILPTETEVELLFCLLMILPLVFYQYSEYKQWIYYPFISALLFGLTYILPRSDFNINLNDQDITVFNTLVWVTLFLWVVILNYWSHYEYGRTENNLTANNLSLNKLLKAYEIKEYELIESNRIIGKRNRDLEHIIHIISHDLKEPVQSLVTGSTLLQNESLEPEIKANLLNEIIYAREELNYMYDGLRRYSSVCLSSKLEKKPLDVVMKTIKKDYAKNENLNILAPYIPRCEVAFSDFVVLINELVKNSLEYNKQDIVQVNMQMNKHNKVLTVDYIDNSIGFKTNEEDVFKIFYRRCCDSKNVKMRGVGLAIIKKIVNFYGGTIQNNKLVTEGVHFVINIPV